MIEKFVPEAGDIVWLEFSPQTGHEQAGHRPALVLSPSSYNGKRGMMVCCPLTSQVKGYPFEVEIDKNGVALSDQVKSLDWKARNASFKGKAHPAAIAKVRANIKALVGIK